MSKRKRATTPERANLSHCTLSLTAYEGDVVSNLTRLLRSTKGHAFVNLGMVTYGLTGMNSTAM